MRALAPSLVLATLALPAHAAGSWSVQSTRPDILLSVDFADGQEGWTAGSTNGIGPTIYHTTDGGKSWQLQQNSLSTFSWLSIAAAPDGQHLWAGGLGAFFIFGDSAFSTDGGETWNTLPGEFLASAFQDVHALDADHAWMAGFWSRLFGENEGVAIWQSESSSWEYVDWGIDTGARYVWFVDELHGWMSGGQFPVSDADGGRRAFEHGPVLPGAGPLGGAPADGPAYAAAIAKTDDGGQTWRQVYSDVGRFYLNQIQFVNRNDGWVVGEADLTSVILRTRDGGETWQEQPFPSQLEHGLIGLSMVDRRNGWAVGFKGGAFNPTAQIVRTSDGGETWTLEPFEASFGTLAIDMVDRSTGWAVGGNNFSQTAILQYFDPDAAPRVVIELADTPTQASPGDVLSWRTSVRNTSGQPQSGDLWVSVTSPALADPAPVTVLLRGGVQLPTDAQRTLTIDLPLPASLPSGVYDVEVVFGPFGSYDATAWFDVEVN